MTEPHNTNDNSYAAEKVRGFPHAPGVYLMKDAEGRVIYIGKAKDLRSRAGSYFLKAAAEDPRTAQLVTEIRDIDFLQMGSEIDAILAEARLIKDILPKFNRDLRDDKTFPYLEIVTREDFPRVRVTRKPKSRGTKLFGPFTNSRGLRGAVQVLQKIFKFRTCNLDIDETDERWKWFRPCLLASIDQCTAPCNQRISKEEYRKLIRRFQRLLEGNRESLLNEMRHEMQIASTELRFEEAAELRDQIQHIETLDQRGDIEKDPQPKVFPIDPKRGLVGLRKVLGLKDLPRTIEGIDIAHLAGTDTVASVVQFFDGMPFKPGYRRLKIRSVEGVDDFACIREVVYRRFKHFAETDEPQPDIFLIDGGRGQLHAATEVMDLLRLEQRPVVISLAKREEEIYTTTADEPIRLSRHAYALRLLQYVRDESHRFAQHYHHILRRKSTLEE